MNDDVVWKKISIFFRFSYWKYNLLRHNFDMMHIEKNMMDNIIGTLLDIQGKMKDNLEACEDLKEIDLRQQFHLYTTENGKTYILVACHTMSNENKTNFLQVLKDVGVLDDMPQTYSNVYNLRNVL